MTERVNLIVGFDQPWGEYLRRVPMGYSPLHVADHLVRSGLPIAALGSMPTVLVTSPAKGFKTLNDLVGAAKSAAKPLSFGSSGIGTAPPP